MCHFEKKKYDLLPVIILTLSVFQSFFIFVFISIITFFSNIKKNKFILSLFLMNVIIIFFDIFVIGIKYIRCYNIIVSSLNSIFIIYEIDANSFFPITFCLFYLLRIVILFVIFFFFKENKNYLLLLILFTFINLLILSSNYISLNNILVLFENRNIINPSFQKNFYDYSHLINR